MVLVMVLGGDLPRQFLKIERPRPESPAARLLRGGLEQGCLGLADRVEAEREAAVGLLLSLFDLRPEELLHSLGDNAREIFEAAVDLVRWAIPYILLGAVIVAPIWLVLTLLRALRRR